MTIRAKELTAFASLAAAEGRADLALRLAGGADALSSGLGMTLLPTYGVRFEGWVAAACQVLGAGRSAAHWSEGLSMTAEQALAEACTMELQRSQERGHESGSS